MDKVKQVFSSVVNWYNSLSPNWQRAIQVAAAILSGYVAGKVL